MLPDDGLFHREEAETSQAFLKYVSMTNDGYTGRATDSANFGQLLILKVLDLFHTFSNYFNLQKAPFCRYVDRLLKR